MLREWVSCYGSQGHNKPFALLFTTFGKRKKVALFYTFLCMNGYM